MTGGGTPLYLIYGSAAACRDPIEGRSMELAADERVAATVLTASGHPDARYVLLVLRGLMATSDATVHSGTITPSAARRAALALIAAAREADGRPPLGQSRP